MPQPSMAPASSSTTTSASIHYCWTHEQDLIILIRQVGGKREGVGAGAHNSRLKTLQKLPPISPDKVFEFHQEELEKCSL